MLTTIFRDWSKMMFIHFTILYIATGAQFSSTRKRTVDNRREQCVSLTSGAWLRPARLRAGCLPQWEYGASFQYKIELHVPLVRPFQGQLHDTNLSLQTWIFKDLRHANVSLEKSLLPKSSGLIWFACLFGWLVFLAVWCFCFLLSEQLEFRWIFLWSEDRFSGILSFLDICHPTDTWVAGSGR